MIFRYHRIENRHVSMRYSFIPATNFDQGELRSWLTEHIGRDFVDWRFAHRGSVLIKDEAKAFEFRMRWG